MPEPIAQVARPTLLAITAGISDAATTSSPMETDAPLATFRPSISPMDTIGSIAVALPDVDARITGMCLQS